MIDSESNTMRTRLGCICAFLLLCSFASPRLDAQAVNDSSTAEQPAKITPPSAVASTSTPRRTVDLRVDRTLVLINVTVTDPLNRFVTGLDKEHFRLFEDKVEQEILQFSSEDAPISIGLVFDTSGSMGAKLQKSRQAAAEFFKTANPSDEFFFNSTTVPNSSSPSPPIPTKFRAR
jgi:hypothetical protein